MGWFILVGGVHSLKVYWLGFLHLVTSVLSRLCWQEGALLIALLLYQLELEKEENRFMCCKV